MTPKQILFTLIGIVLFMSFIVWCTLEDYKYARNRDCSTYSQTPVHSVPARCASYFGITR